MFRLFMVIRLVILLGPPNSFRPPAFRDGSMNMALAVMASSSFRRHFFPARSVRTKRR
jgi:hypothetical protein